MKKSLAIILCLFFIFGISSYGADTGFLSGRVSTDDNLQIINDAKIVVYNSYREIVDSTFSNEFGYFELTLTGGEYFLSAESGNFIREFYPSEYKISEAEKIMVYPGQNISVSFSLDRGGWLGGTFDYLGNQIDRGLVTAIKIDEPFAGWDRSVIIEGQRPMHYVLNGLIPGAYKVVAMASNKKTIFFPGVTRIEDADIIYVERNTGVPDISFILEPVGIGHVSGRVYDVNTGEGLTGIPIFAYQWREYWSDPNMQSVLSSDDGTYSFDLPEGDYNFYLNCDNCIPGGGRIAYYFNNQYNPMLADIISVSSGTIIDDIDFAINLNISHNLSISGNIVDRESGQGLHDVVISAIDYYSGDAVSATYSVSSGDFSLDNLPSGEYLIQFSGSNVIPFFYRSTESWQDGEIIVLNVNHSGIHEEAITQDYGNLGLAISGTVLTPNGPISGARVYAVPVGQDDPIAYGNTSASGEYEISTGLVNGYYHVICDLYGYNFEVYPIEIYLNHLENPSADNIDFLLQPAVTSVADNEVPNIPDRLEVLGNYPNPFNGETRIQVFSGYGAAVNTNLQVFNILGQMEGNKVVILQPGLNLIEWNGGDFGHDASSGIYFYRLEGADKTHKMIFLK